MRLTAAEKLHRLHDAIKNRCYNRNSPSYPNYGGRGIKMDEDWKRNWFIFAAYVSELEGYGVPRLTIDRIDNDGDYVPGNIRWATAKQQSANRRNPGRHRKFLGLWSTCYCRKLDALLVFKCY